MKNEHSVYFNFYKITNLILKHSIAQMNAAYNKINTFSIISLGLWVMAEQQQKYKQKNCYLFNIKTIKVGTPILGHVTGYFHASQAYTLYSCQHMQYLCQNHGRSAAMNMG